MIPPVATLTLSTAKVFAIASGSSESVQPRAGLRGGERGGVGRVHHRAALVEQLADVDGQDDHAEKRDEAERHDDGGGAALVVATAGAREPLRHSHRNVPLSVGFSWIGGRNGMDTSNASFTAPEREALLIVIVTWPASCAAAGSPSHTVDAVNVQPPTERAGRRRRPWPRLIVGVVAAHGGDPRALAGGGTEVLHLPEGQPVFEQAEDEDGEQPDDQGELDRGRAIFTDEAWLARSSLIYS